MTEPENTRLEMTVHSPLTADEIKDIRDYSVLRNNLNRHRINSRLAQRIDLMAVIVEIKCIENKFMAAKNKSKETMEVLQEIKHFLDKAEKMDLLIEAIRTT